MSEKIAYLRKKHNLTLEDIGNYVGVSKSTVKKWESGAIANMKRDKIAKISEVLHTTPAYLMGWQDEALHEKYSNIIDIGTKRVPLLGDIACGTPIFVDEEKECYVNVGANIKVDFCLRAVGDSMINARIHDGDIVFIRKQPIVNNGEIAAVIIDDSATLKRVYYYREERKLVLTAENPMFPPMVYTDDELDGIIILGKAVAFQSDVK